MNNSQLIERYKNVLSKIDSTNFITGTDLYSGVFLSTPTEQYLASSFKLMIVGRETAGWNTKNGKNTIGRIVNANKSGKLDDIIEESFTRYAWHLQDKPGGTVKKTSTSTFQRFLIKTAEKLQLSPQAIMYQNLYAWDFNGRSPLTRSTAEFDRVQQVSAELLAISIEHTKPDVIIFAAGCNAQNDKTIKMALSHLAKNKDDSAESKIDIKTIDLVKRRYWHFVYNDIDCYRIAHPRRQDAEYVEYRTLALDAVTEKFMNKGAL